MMNSLAPPSNDTGTTIPATSLNTHSTPITATDSPVNGWAGLTHWRQDLTAGLLVALVSMPLSLGIAVASGAPSAAGLITAIVAGFVFPLVGGAYVAVTSPAAGMAPVLFQSIHTMGRGNMQVGYPLVLPLIVLTGLIQLVLSRFRVKSLANLLPTGVISGMLTAIGLIVLIKQLPLLLGTNFASPHLLGMLQALPTALRDADPTTTLLGVITLLMIAGFTLLSRWVKPLRILPPFLYALVMGTLLGLVLPLAPEAFLQLPRNPLEGLVWPNWNALLSDRSNWQNALVALVTLLSVNSIESVATVCAVDGMDPYHRKSDMPHCILGLGVCNVASGMIGGLTVIPEVMRSTVGIMAGARTQWANFWNAFALLLGWLILQPVLTHIPLTVLAAILMVTSLTLCSPTRVLRVWHAGKATFLVFVVTVSLTIGVDLLWGLIGGMVLNFLLTATHLTSRADRVSHSADAAVKDKE
jgi:carbonic anhydrase